MRGLSIIKMCGHPLLVLRKGIAILYVSTLLVLDLTVGYTDVLKLVVTVRLKTH